MTDILPAVHGVRARDGLADGRFPAGVLGALTRDEAAALVDACVAEGTPARFPCTAAGPVELEPVDPGDLVFAAAAAHHRRRGRDGRRVLGPDAVPVVADMFRARGWTVRVTDVPRRVDASDRDRALAWLDEWVAAAVAERPALREWADEYLRTRGGQLAAGTLRIVVDSRDVVAWSP